MKALLQEIRAWLIVLWTFFFYLLYRLGIGKCPTLMPYRYECLVVVQRVLGWSKRLGTRFGERCPNTDPVVVCANHAKKDDPFIIYAAIYYGTGRKIEVEHMMRDDFFSSSLKNWLYDFDEIVQMVGAHQISRDRVTLAQLKVFVNLLRDNRSFLMFPGRSRSRSGMFMEYREGVDEPGGPTFFAAQAQRAGPGKRVPLVPAARNYNPATKQTVVVFGDPIYVPEGARRPEQRRVDFQIIESMGMLLEIHAVHLIGGILYLRCLHGLPDTLPISALRRDIDAVIGMAPGCQIDPAVRENPHGEIGAALRYLESKGMLRVQGDNVVVDPQRVLASPEIDTKYRDTNPVKYFTNQILHLRELTCAMEDVVLGVAAASVV